MPPRKTNTYRTTNRTWKTGRTFTMNTSRYPCKSPKFNTARTECQWRIGSYRNVYSQFTMTGNRTNWSPAIANRWVRYVNTGARVYKFNNNEFTRFFGYQCTTCTPTAARMVLRRKYGMGIKDVTRGNSCWLIATTRNVTGRPFNNYNWY